jgi:hypothetical protein
MTYKARLDRMLVTLVEKSNAFIDLVNKEGQGNSQTYHQMYAEWEAAEKEYVSLLKRVEAGEIDLNSSTCNIAKAIKAGVRDLAALFL